jgi:ABC-type Fe3+-siderophore transport system permease subunit
MKHKLFSLICVAMLAFLFVIVGVLALFDVAGAEIYFWTRRAIESKTGKIVWILVSFTCFISFLALAVSEYRRQ